MERLQSKWLKYISLGGLGVVSLLTLYLCAYVPIFTDEINIKVISARYFLDSGIAMTLHPTCVPEFTEKVPLLFAPFRMIESLLYQDLSNPLKLRWMGIFQYLLLIALSARIFSGAVASPLLWSIAIFTFGQLPFTMVLNRPEIPMALLIVILLILAASAERNRGAPGEVSRPPEVLGPLIVLFISAWLLSFHPKALFLSPLLFAVSLRIGRRPLTRGLLLAGITCEIVLSALAWQKPLACPLDPERRAVFATSAASFLFGGAGFRDGVAQLLENLYNSRLYFRNISFSFFKLGYDRVYLPAAGQNLVGNGEVWRLVFAALNYSFFFLMGVLGIGSLWLTIKGRKNVLLLGCFFTLVPFLLFPTRKAMYDFGLIFPLFIFWVVLAARTLASEKLARITPALTVAVVFLSLVSQIILLVCYGGYREAWSKGGRIPGIRFAVSGFQSEVTREKVHRLGEKCGIFPVASNYHLVTDDVTYPFFSQGKIPYYDIFVLSLGPEAAQEKAIKFLQERKSSGFIGDCGYLPSRLSGSAPNDSGICCVGKEALMAKPY